MPIEVPSLVEFLKKHKEMFEPYKKAGIIGKDMTWEQHVPLLKQEHALLCSMDQSQLAVYVQERQRAQMPNLVSIKEQLDKMINALKLRKVVQEDLRDVKDRAEFNRRKNSRRK